MTPAGTSELHTSWCAAMAWQADFQLAVWYLQVLFTPGHHRVSCKLCVGGGTHHRILDKGSPILQDASRSCLTGLLELPQIQPRYDGNHTKQA